MNDHPFAHLHLHTGYSLLESTCRIDDVMKAAKEHGMKAVAITDHNVMYGVPEFCEAARREGIKPIIGCELNIAGRSRLDEQPIQNDIKKIVLLAENDKGFRNLVTLVSKAHLETKWTVPCIDMELLFQHRDGLIGLSAWRDGMLFEKMVSGGEDEAGLMAEMFSDIFGKDNFFIEIQNQGLEDDEMMISMTECLARCRDLPLVATNNVHYIRKEHAQTQRLLEWMRKEDDHHFEDVPLKSGTDQLYFKSGAEMLALFGHVPVRNAAMIAERCKVDALAAHGVHFPAYPITGKDSPSEHLQELVIEGLETRYGISNTVNPDAEPRKTILARARTELDTIEKNGFINYFLMVADYVRFANEKDIPIGPGRGTTGGSIVAYALGITNIDPLQYGLLFELCLNQHQPSPPDIAIDVCMERRNEVVEYIKQKYGPGNVAQIITFSACSKRTAARHCGRALHTQEWADSLFVDLVAADSPPQGQPPGTVARESLHGLADMIGKAQEHSAVLEGLPLGSGCHAAGLLLSDEDLSGLVPLCRDKDGEITTQYGQKSLQKLGFVKVDLLGLKNLTVIHETVSLVAKNQRTVVSFNRDFLNDEATYNRINNGDTAGVFQLEGCGMREFVKKMSVKNIEDMAVAITLYRPGMLYIANEYLNRRQSKTPVGYDHPLLEPILRETCGMILYREQFARILVALAGEPCGETGYTIAEADSIRQVLAAKEITVVAEQMLRFADGCIRTGSMTRSEAMLYFDTLLESIGHCTCKAHAIGTALLAYQCAHLKTHFPKEYEEARTRLEC